MQRRPNWKPVIVLNGHQTESGKVDEGETISHAAHSNDTPSTGDEDRLVDIRFTIGVALALGLPALIGAGLYLVATLVLRLS